MPRAVVVLVTVSSAREAERISRALLTEKLAACVGDVPGCKSRYWWKGRVETSIEHLLLIKTLKSKTKNLIKRIRQLHSYSVPEIIFLPITAGHSDYLRWIEKSVKR